MLEKSYYRFKELLQHFNITSDELLYNVENHSLRLSFMVENLDLLVGRYKNDMFVGFGIGSYYGPVSVDRATSIKLFSEGKAKCTDVFIRKNGFKTYSSEYPFDVKIPNSLIKAWLPVTPSEFGTASVSAKLNAHQGASPTAAAHEIFSALKQFSQDKSAEIPTLDKLNRFPDKAIYIDDFKFVLEQSCFLSQDLHKLNLIGSDTASKPQAVRLSAQTEGNSSKPNRSTNQINDLIKNLIGLYPTKSAAALWKILQENFEDNDDIDPGSILDEVGDTELYWTDSRGQEKRLAYKTFRNKVSEYK